MTGILEDLEEMKTRPRYASRCATCHALGAITAADAEKIVDAWEKSALSSVDMSTLLSKHTEFLVGDNSVRRHFRNEHTL